MPPKKAAPAPLSRGKRWLFTLITISLPILALVAAELILRSFGWGGYPAFLREAGKLPDGRAVCLVEPAASKPYFYANPNRPGYAEQTNFLMPKPEGVVRIVLIGESAAKGYPQPRNLAIASFLREMLNDAWAEERRVEVIDLGTTAVASFPLVYAVRDALRYDPDLFIFYTGNNEFFGAYGTASINASGTLPPWALRAMRSLRGLALVQVLDGWLYGKSDENRTLMEQMIGRTFIPSDSGLRAAAGRNLRANLGEMLAATRAAGVPAIVATTASNESGLAPLGADDVSGLEDAQLVELRGLLGRAADALDSDPARAAEILRQAVALAPRHATARFRLGQALAASGDPKGAREAFLAARDLDTMPWRPVSQTEEAIRAAAREHGAVLCDIATIFRDQSPEGASGWDLLDDHVHLSLAGQARAARSLVGAMTRLEGPLQLTPSQLARVATDESYADWLGSNLYDQYRVDHTLRVLFGIPFMKNSNPEAFARFEESCRDIESGMSPAILAAAREWQTFKPHAGGLRPLTGMVARILLREGKTAEALPLFQIAARQVPDYTSWYLEYVYFALACREKLEGKLDETARAAAAAAIEQGRFLLDHGESQTGLTERYIGRLHQLRGEWTQAIPYLLAARPRMSAEDLVACDQALILSYVNTGQTKEALALAEDGIKNSGKFANIYTQLRDGVVKSAQSKPPPP